MIFTQKSKFQKKKLELLTFDHTHISKHKIEICLYQFPKEENGPNLN